MVSSQAKKGKKLTKTQARDSKKFQKLYRELHTKDSGKDKNGFDKGKHIRNRAWEALTGGDKAEWVPYVKRWAESEL